ncbi:MAG TPA: sigma-70 family RNA polymerase sigma factor [Mycobacterium sp.]|nr:sigma-70 family RNA polymerase sigma factor [Mycobacterium sp.]
MADDLGPHLDAESADWVHALRTAGVERDAAVARLHGYLLGVARTEVRRRCRGGWPVAGAEADDVAHHAAADALLAVDAKLASFRGESRFTTWAYRFVIFEVSAQLGRHFWRHPTVLLGTRDAERLVDRFTAPEHYLQWRELADAVHRAVYGVLTERQRALFIAIVIDRVPPEELVSRYATTRNALYKTVFDARRKLRAELVANGQLDAPATGDCRR